MNAEKMIADAECMGKYGMTCDKVEETLQANIQACLDNRGGRRCLDKEYQDRRLMPLTQEDRDGIAAGQNATIRRNHIRKWGSY